MDKHTVHKYLMASPATSKLRSTTKRTPKPNTNTTPQCSNPEVVHVAEDGGHENEQGDMEQGSKQEDDDTSNEDEPRQGYYPNIIPEIEDESISNVFCFGAFADKMTGVVYNDCTGNCDNESASFAR